MIKVESGVAMTERVRQSKYPFSSMGVGDSFAASVDDIASLRSCASTYGKRHGVKFTVRKTGESARCWRTS